MNRIIFNILFLFCVSLKVSAQGLIAHYPLSGHVNDISGNKNNGVVSGGVFPTTDRFGNYCGALMFNGIDGYITIPDSKSLSSPFKAFSVTTWFKLNPDPSGNNFKWLTIICKGDQSSEIKNTPHYRVQIFQGNTQSTISINSDFTKNDFSYQDHLISYDQWYFLAVVYDGNQVKMYLNGKLLWSYPYFANLDANNQPLNIGRDIPGVSEYFNGALSDLKIFNYALNENEILSHFADLKSYGFESAVEVECADDININTSKGQCGNFISFPQPKVLSNCGNSLIKQVKGPLTGSYLKVGEEKIVYRVENSTGYNRLCSFTVNVIDNESPIFEMVKDTVILLKHGMTSTIYKYNTPKATDNCGIRSIDLMDGIQSGQPFPIGRHVLTFKAVDFYGNISLRKAIVDVRENLQIDDLVTVNPILDSINSKKTTTISDPDLNFDSIPLEVGLTIELSDLQFIADRTGLVKSSLQQLDSLASFIKKNPQVVIEIAGHTNGLPSDDYCFRLSEGRAKACYNYLLSKNVSKANLRYKGYGKTKLKFPNQPENPENQRVEIIIKEIKY